VAATRAGKALSFSEKGREWSKERQKERKQLARARVRLRSI